MSLQNRRLDHRGSSLPGTLANVAFPALWGNMLCNSLNNDQRIQCRRRKEPPRWLPEAAPASSSRSWRHTRPMVLRRAWCASAYFSVSVE